MKIIPNLPYDNNSKAEKIFYKALEELQFDCHDAVAFHSLNITNHRSKRFSEADFIVISKYGVFTFEVKGGGVFTQDGYWYTKSSNEIFSIQHPFKQGASASNALVDKLSFVFKNRKERIPTGYGVVFPDVIWTVDGFEWDRLIICDKHNLQNLNQWMLNFFAYYNSKHNNDCLLNADEIKQIADFVRPEFEIKEIKLSEIDKVIAHSNKLTQDQQKLLSVAFDNTKILCCGGAGTGKTFLAIELLNRLVLTQDKKILFICKSAWLKNFVSSKVKHVNIVFSTPNSLKIDMRRNALKSYGYLVVDEGQDLLNKEDIENLNSVIEGGFNNGHWYFFYDKNYQANLLAKVDLEIYEWLSQLNNVTKLNLSENCRNSKNIVNTISEKLKCDLGKSQIVDGDVVIEIVGKEKELATKLNLLLDELLTSEFEPGLITILSPNDKSDSLIRFLPKETLAQIATLDDYAIRHHPCNQISFASIQNFKGLENQIVILIDLPQLDKAIHEDSSFLHKQKISSEIFSKYYVGMTRARAKLYCLWLDNWNM